MKIVFRLNYRTVPGQSLWLKLVTVPGGQALRVEQMLPLQWLNHEQWELVLDLHGEGLLSLEYFYQLRQEGNGVELDEWNGPRSAAVDSFIHEALLLCDTWCSAGTVDYAFETHAFNAVLSVRGPFAPPPAMPDANHVFQLRMAAVPPGCVPCLLGNAPALGAWDFSQALPMQEVAANVWQTRLDLPEGLPLEYKYGLFDPQAGRALSFEVGPNRFLDSRSIAVRQMTQVSDEAYRRDSETLYRAAGVAIPVFSLRSARGLGVGEFADLKLLGDWAAGVGLKLIQILPINDTTSSHDWTDSYPYSAISAFALHPVYLSIGDLGYAMPAAFTRDLEAARKRLNALDSMDYEQVMRAKRLLTRRVFERHFEDLTASAGFLDFLEENSDWVLPYAAFCVKRDQYGTADFSQWQDDAVFDRAQVKVMACPAHSAWPHVSYHIWLQYELDRQLLDAVRHLHRRGISFKGDLPIGIDRHGVDAWCSPRAFNLDAQAGAPPDAFAQKGQNWGFPTYHWAAMREGGYAWWRSRFAHLSRYFDAYRIDHILGFFRIWQIPRDQVEGIMGYFDPALPVHIDEFRDCGIPFDFNRYCRPYIHEDFLWERFGNSVSEAKESYLDVCENGFYQLRGHVATQRLIVAHFASQPAVDPDARERLERLRSGLLDCASDVMFFEVPGSNGTLFHPRCLMQVTRSFQQLESDLQWRVDELYIDYFHRRQDGFWQARGYETLPVMRRASPMLLCGEDLGMVPACVPGVLRELGILSLEIQCMPKNSELDFSDPAHAPYMSVVSPSTHDMPTLREWWREDSRVTANFAWQMLDEAFPETELTGDLAARIVRQHLESPAMWAIFPLQDLLAIDVKIRHPDPAAERINVPANPNHRWRYRMHLELPTLATAHDFNEKLAGLIHDSGR